MAVTGCVVGQTVHRSFRSTRSVPKIRVFLRLPPSFRTLFGLETESVENIRHRADGGYSSVDLRLDLAHPSTRSLRHCRMLRQSNQQNINDVRSSQYRINTSSADPMR